MKYKVAIVEDNESYANTIKEYISRYSLENSIECEVFMYKDGDEITDEFEMKYHIIFLDIEMKRQDGMKTAELIRKHDEEVIIIFITNMSQYAIKGYTVNAMSFLLKPVPYFAFSQEFKKSIDKVNKQQKSKSFLVQDLYGLTKVVSNKIIYIESIKHELVMVTTTGTFQFRGTLKSFENDLEGFDFNRCNNSYLVNLAYVSGVEDEFVVLGEHKLKISRPRKKQFMEALTTYIGDK